MTQPTPTPDLLPCPFCGGDVHYSDGDSAHIVCFNPGCNVLDITLKASFVDFDKLVEQWNTRPQPTHETALVRAREALNESKDLLHGMTRKRVYEALAAITEVLEKK